MQFPQKKDRKTWLAFALGLIIIGIIGYTDALTGDYSLDVFYLAVIFVMTWFTGAGYGLLCVIESVLLEAVADYHVHLGNVFTGIYYWNWVSDLVTISALCLLVSFIRRSLDSST